MVNKYNCSEDLKKAMVTKLLQPGGPSVLELSKKQGLSKTTIYNWIKKYGVIGDNSIMAANTTINKSSSDYQSASSKLKAIIDTENLTEEEIGTYCRQKGVYYSELQAWKQTFIDCFDSSNTKTEKEYRQKYFNLEKENKQLHSELNRKNKALAEASAILVLQKKANLIWGGGQEDT